MGGTGPKGSPDRSVGDAVKTASCVVALVGPSCVGKTWLAAFLRCAQAPVLARVLGVDDPAKWPLLHANECRPHEIPTGSILLHCELRPAWLEAGVESAGVLRLLRSAGRIAFVTLWAPPDILQERLNRRLATQLTTDLRALRVRRALARIHPYRKRRGLFRRPSELWQLYTTWFDFCGQLGDWPHWVVRSGVPDNPSALHTQPRDQPFWTD